MKELSIYIHIPFCDHKCIYCDFYSIINYDNVSNYLIQLKEEINYYSQLYASGREVISIFFGGGTPSFMEPEYISEIITYIKQNFQVSNKVEITLETNPGTVDEKKLKNFKQANVNRISIGVQSFDENELKFLTRIHDSKTAIETVHAAENAGFEDISVDLIFNLPNQSKETWQNNLIQAVNLPITHISTYSLILEKGTILNKLVIDGKVKMQDSDYDADLYEKTIDILLDKGFIQYEVSNFCLPGYECEHNNAYWRYKDYLGFGTSAHSFVDGKRWWNYSSLNFYIEKISKNHEAIAGYEKLTTQQMHDEYVMLAMRSKGLCISDYKNYFKDNWLKESFDTLNKLKTDGYLSIDDNFIKFTPKGYALCDEILTKIL